jgi:putative tricarboxylic transport membrane protein
MNNDQVSSAVWFFIGLTVCLGSIQFKVGNLKSPGAGFMPFLSGVAIIFFSVTGFLFASIRKKQGEGWSNSMQNLQWKNSLVVLASLSIYVLLLERLGFLISTALFMAFLLRTFALYRWHLVIGGAILTAIASYALFKIWLEVQLPIGPFGI